MSYWSKNPELLDEITIGALPEEWKDKVKSGELDLYDVPEGIRDKAMLEGEREYWAGIADGEEKKSTEDNYGHQRNL